MGEHLWREVVEKMSKRASLMDALSIVCVPSPERKSYSHGAQTNVFC